MDIASGRKATGIDTDDLEERNAAIARRAYEISLGSDAGTPEENWWRAAAEINARSDAEASEG
jgi:hypothetical protein